MDFGHIGLILKLESSISHHSNDLAGNRATVVLFYLIIFKIIGKIGKNQTTQDRTKTMNYPLDRPTMSFGPGSQLREREGRDTCREEEKSVRGVFERLQSPTFLAKGANVVPK